jgi:predicted transcriptional regulator YheO
VYSRSFVTSFTEYNKDKVPMDVATSLVVNHVNIGVLCLFVLCLCLCLWRSCKPKIIHNKDWITVGILCMNVNLFYSYIQCAVR